MNELRQALEQAGVPAESIDNVITYLELNELDDLRFYKSLEDYQTAGVESKSAQRKLVSLAEKLDTKYKAKNAAEVEAERARASIEATKAAAEEQRAVAEADADAATLVEAYTDEDTWTDALQRKGILEFDVETYIAGIMALLVSNIGVFEAIPKLMSMIKDYAEKNAKPVPRLFYDLQMILVKRHFGLVVAATDDTNYNGVPIYATQEDMLDLFNRMQNDLVPCLLNSANTVGKWFSLYASQSMNEYFAQQVRGKVSGANYPNPAPIDEAGKALRISINRTFAGNGIQKALAIRNEYKTFVKVLNDPALPQSVGAVDLDGVLAQLGFDADAATIRSERFIINFVINLIKADEYKKGRDELQFYSGLYYLANQIDWSGLSGNANDADLMKQYSAPVVDSTRAGTPILPSSAREVPTLGVNNMGGRRAAISVGSAANPDAV